MQIRLEDATRVKHEVVRVIPQGRVSCSTMKHQIGLGRLRGPADGCRRYLPVAFKFDSRAWMLAMEIDESWEPAVKEQWLTNQRRLKEHVLHQFGVEEGERKIEDFASLGMAPWSVVAPHNEIMTEVRGAFAFGAYYSALLGAAGLGERILNDLVLSLRASFPEHAASKKVFKKKSFNDWNVMIEALEGWGVLNHETARSCTEFARLRHDSVHYRSDLTLDARANCLTAMEMLRRLIDHVFSPHGGPPRFIAETAGHSFLALGAESDPVVQRYFIPASALVSPDFEFRNELSELWDEGDYGDLHSVPELSDEEFASRYGGRIVSESS